MPPHQAGQTPGGGRDPGPLRGQGGAGLPRHRDLLDPARGRGGGEITLGKITHFQQGLSHEVTRYLMAKPSEKTALFRIDFPCRAP